MAGLTHFCYRPGFGFLYRLDPRFKLLFLAMISLAALKTTVIALSALSAVIALMLLQTPAPFKSALREIRYFFLILLFVLTARALATPGEPLVQLGVVSITGEGVVDGTMICWRLVVIVLLSLLLVTTTRPAEMKAAVQHLLQPLPFIPEKRVAVMMGLVMRFMPLILDQAAQTANAQRARGVENRKNPLYRSKKLLMPVIRRSFETADKLAASMEARCYSETRTDPEFTAKPGDWGALAGVLGFCAASIVL